MEALDGVFVCCVGSSTLLPLLPLPLVTPMVDDDGDGEDDGYRRSYMVTGLIG